MVEKAILAGGCFWGVEELMRKKEGIISTRVGYTGGDLANPTYDDVKTGKTGHAEAMELIFDPEVISFRDILSVFFQIHDPTTENRQGNDIGSQYRSAIFYTSEQQKYIAERTIKDVEMSGLWLGDVVTEVAPAEIFWEAEDFHQDYLQKHPNGYNCHFPRPNWVLPESEAEAV